MSGEDNPDNAMKQLYEFSVIGFYSLGGGGGAEYVWKYRNTKSTFNENASQFRVHSGFKDVMGLKKFTRSEYILPSSFFRTPWGVDQSGSITKKPIRWTALA